MKSLSIPACAFAALALAASSRAGVLVVDANGAGDYVDLQAAVDAAAEGDTILVRRPPVISTRFEGVVIDGKSLLLQGDMLDPARVGPIVVRNLAPDQRVELSYLHVNPLGLSDLVGSRRGRPDARIERGPGVDPPLRRSRRHGRRRCGRRRSARALQRRDHRHRQPRRGRRGVGRGDGGGRGSRPGTPSCGSTERKSPGEEAATDTSGPMTRETEETARP